MTAPALPAEVAAALAFFRKEHDPAVAPFALLSSDQGLLFYVPAGLPTLNAMTLVHAVGVALEHPDRMAEFLTDLEDEL